ncbi:thioredoxin family protein [Acrocarpospora catenulata]|uniref:thioredoxin family protein n=1 Tax=Acrocarpospora catenulata TaxID=2836182 RepID=UPI001BD9A43D|nr:thioredoxin family protein [Acrocarpospora catenulata]
MRGLETLELRSDRMTGDFPFPDSPLIKVKLGGQRLGDRVFGRLAELPLGVLSIEGDAIDGIGLDALAIPPDLGYLRLAGGRLDPRELRRLVRCRKLTVLSLAGEADAETLLGLPSLREVDFDRVPRAVAARLLFAGFAVNGLSSPADRADAYARMLAPGDRRPRSTRPRIADPAALHTLLRGEAPVMIDFTEPDSVACEWLDPVLDRVLAEHAEELTGATIDVTRAPGAAEHFQITTVPAVLLLRGGHELLRLTGATISPAALIREVDRVVGEPYVLLP